MSTSEPIRPTVILPQPVRNSTRLPSAIPQIKDDVIARLPSLRGFNDELKAWWKNARFAMQTDYEELADGSNAAINSNNALSSAFRTEISERKEGDVTIVKQVQELIIQQGGPNRIFVRTTAPDGPLTGDLWFDSDDDFRPWFYDGADWVDARDKTISGAVAAISTEQTVRISGDLALSQRIDATLSRIDDPDTGLVGLSNSIELVETSVSSQGGTLFAHGQRLDQIDSDITAQDGTISGHTTAIGNIQTDVTAKGLVITAQGSRISGLESTVGTTDGAGLRSRVGTIETTFATKVFAEAKKTEAITAAGTASSALVSTEQTARATADGNLASWGVTLGAGDAIAGMKFYAASGQGGTRSKVSFLTDVFEISNGSTSEAPFEVSGGRTRVKCLVAGLVSTFSHRFNPDQISKTFPTISFVEKNGLAGTIAPSAAAYFTDDSLIFQGWFNGADGHASNRFGSPDLRMDLYASSYLQANNAKSGDWCQFGPCHRFRTNGGAWGAWQMQGWIDHYLTPGVDAPSVLSIFPVNANGVLSGTTDIQVGIRVCYMGSSPSSVTLQSTRVWARFFNS